MNKIKNITALVCVVLVLGAASFAFVPRSAEAAPVTSSVSFVELIQRIQELIELVEKLTLLVQQISPVNPNPDPVIPISQEYTIDDVRSVMVKSYGSVEVDGGYYLYTVTLAESVSTAGVIKTFKVYPMSSFEMIETAVRETGFVGDVEELMKLAKKEEDFKEIDDHAPIIKQTNADVSLVKILVSASNKVNEGESICGPVEYGSIDWGDGNSEKVWGLGCSSVRQDIEVSHNYKSSGVYDVSFVDLSGRVAKILVSALAVSVESYTLSDVVKVEVKNVDPIREAIDDEYTLYTIHLKDGSIRTAEMYGMATWDMNQENFYRTGFSGDVQKLLEMAE